MWNKNHQWSGSRTSRTSPILQQPWILTIHLCSFTCTSDTTGTSPVNASDPTQQTSGTSHNSQLILSGTWCLQIVSSSNFVMLHSKSYEMLMNKHMLRCVKSYKTHSISGFNTFHYISKRRAHLLALRWSLRFPYRTALEWNTDSIRCAVVHLQLIHVRFRSLFFNRGFATNTTCGETLLLSTKSALHITSLLYK